MRVLEIYHQTGKTKTQLESESRLTPPPYEYIVLQLIWKEKNYMNV